VAGERVGRRFVESRVSFDTVYAPPFLGTVETADEICRETVDAFVVEPGLGEHCDAEWFDADPETVPPEALAERFSTVRLGRSVRGSGVPRDPRRSDGPRRRDRPMHR
jgi:broad specificity phosphatase PhoE